MTLGAFTGPVSNKDTRVFATTPVLGDWMTLQYVEPLNRKHKEKPVLTIKSIAHGFRASPLEFGESGSCNIDAVCETKGKWKNQLRAVVMMITDSGQRFCTGTMINNALQNGKQFMLTANHCIFEDVDDWIAVFNYQKAVCGQTRAEPTLNTIQGMKKIGKEAAADLLCSVLGQE